MKRNIILYGHGGSGNHGCEAIIRSLTKILKHTELQPVVLMSLKPTEDAKYDLNKIEENRKVWYDAQRRTTE